MNINLIAIDANKTIGKNPVLVDVAPSYVYENGKRTGEVSGFKYTVALPDKAFEKLTVKIDGECKLEKPDDRHSCCQCGKGLNCTKSVFALCALSTPCRGSAIGVVLPPIVAM